MPPATATPAAAQGATAPNSAVQVSLTFIKRSGHPACISTLTAISPVVQPPVVPPAEDNEFADMLRPIVPLHMAIAIDTSGEGTGPLDTNRTFRQTLWIARMSCHSPLGLPGAYLSRLHSSITGSIPRHPGLQKRPKADLPSGAR
jgi:hypothetical protein